MSEIVSLLLAWMNVNSSEFSKFHFLILNDKEMPSLEDSLSQWIEVIYQNPFARHALQPMKEALWSANLNLGRVGRIKYNTA